MPKLNYSNKLVKNVRIRRSIFNKGPLLEITPQNENDVKSYSLMLKLYNLGTEIKWTSFLFYTIPGLRKAVVCKFRMCLQTDITLQFTIQFSHLSTYMNTACA